MGKHENKRLSAEAQAQEEARQRALRAAQDAITFCNDVFAGLDLDQTTQNVDEVVSLCNQVFAELDHQKVREDAAFCEAILKEMSESSDPSRSAAAAAAAEPEPEPASASASAKSSVHEDLDQLVNIQKEIEILNKRMRAYRDEENAPGSSVDNTAVKKTLGEKIKLYACAFLARVISILGALKEGAGDGLSLLQAGNKSFVLLFFATLTAFSATAELASSSAAHNIRLLIDWLFYGIEPEELLNEPEEGAAPVKRKINLSKFTLRTTLGVCGAIAAWCFFSEVVQTSEFINSIDAGYGITKGSMQGALWTGLSYTIALNAGAMRFVTDNTELLLIVLAMLAGVKDKTHVSLPNKAISLSVGTILALIKATYDALQAYIMILSKFRLKAIYSQLMLLGACTTEAAATYCFINQAMRKHLRELYVHIAHKETITPPYFAGNMAALSLALFLSFVKQDLNRGFCHAIADKYLQSNAELIPPVVFTVIIWLIFAAEVLLISASLTPEFVRFAEFLEGQFKKFLPLYKDNIWPIAVPDSIANAPTDVQVIAMEAAIVPGQPLTQVSRSTLFYPKALEEATERTSLLSARQASYNAPAEPEEHEQASQCVCM